MSRLEESSLGLEPSPEKDPASPREDVQDQSLPPTYEEVGGKNESKDNQPFRTNNSPPPNDTKRVNIVYLKKKTTNSDSMQLRTVMEDSKENSTIEEIKKPHRLVSNTNFNKSRADTVQLTEGSFMSVIGEEVNKEISNHSEDYAKSKTNSLSLIEEKEEHDAHLDDNRVNLNSRNSSQTNRIECKSQ